jgi:2-polyprenyl-3-methyl-5-hydroxy-6-metoxy-1,4-benzoquinol methylase
MDIVEQERAKYAQLWAEVPECRAYSPGLENLTRFMGILKPPPKASLIDLGCGSGEAGVQFRELGLDVSWLDITDAGLHERVPRHRFTQMPLWANWKPPYGYDFGYCCDVMEHMPTEYVMLVLDRIIKACRLAWFTIAFVPDEFGQAIDQPLHLTVQPFKWWLEHLTALGRVIDARDLCGAGLFVVQKRV